MGLGIYGKHPAKGDFLETGLPPALLQVLERWLDAVLAECRANLGGDWERVWDRAGPARPVLRFWLGEDIWGQAICGVMAPSRDRVGRRFPLVMLCTDPDPAAVPPPPVVSTDQGWYDRAEAHLRARLEAPLDAVAHLLDGLAPPGGLADAPSPGTADFWAAGGDATALLADIVLTDHRRAAAGRSYWWLAADPVEDEVFTADTPPPAGLWVDDPFHTPTPDMPTADDDSLEGIWGAPLPTPTLATTLQTDDAVLTEEVPEGVTEDETEGEAEDPAETDAIDPEATEPEAADSPAEDSEAADSEVGGDDTPASEVDVPEATEAEAEDIGPETSETGDVAPEAVPSAATSEDADQAPPTKDAPNTGEDDDLPETDLTETEPAETEPPETEPAESDVTEPALIKVDPVDDDAAPPKPDEIAAAGDSPADWAADALLDASPIGGPAGPAPLASKASGNPAPAPNTWGGNAWLDPDIPEDDLPDLVPPDLAPVGAGVPPSAVGSAPKPRGREVSQVHAGAGLPSGAVLAWFLRGM